MCNNLQQRVQVATMLFPKLKAPLSLVIVQDFDSSVPGIQHRIHWWCYMTSNCHLNLQNNERVCNSLYLNHYSSFTVQKFGIQNSCHSVHCLSYLIYPHTHTHTHTHTHYKTCMMVYDACTKTMCTPRYYVAKQCKLTIWW